MPPRPIRTPGTRDGSRPVCRPALRASPRVIARLHGKRQPVAHIVYSDGLVAISVFVEPLNAPPRNAGAVQQGSINAYTRQVDDYLVTVLGEAPGATLKDVAFSVVRR